MKKSGGTYKQTTVNAVILIVILAMFLYLGVQFSRNFSSMVSTQRTQVFTDNEYVHLSGYVFRDDKVMKQDSRGVIDFSVNDGDRVGVSAMYATFYPTEHLSDGEIAQKQAEINSISKQLSRLESGIKGGLYVSDIEPITNTISSSYYSFIDSILNDDLSSADITGNVLVDALADYANIKGDEGMAQSVAESLKTRKQELINGLGVSGVPLYSDEGIYLFFDTDGYENIFNSKSVSELTPKELERLAESSPESVGEKAAFRITDSPKWYIALPCNEAVCLDFVVGNTYEITLTDCNDVKLDMVLESVNFGEENDEDAYLLFSSFDLSVAGDISRAQNVKILMKSVTGYKIPAEALAEQDGEKGVYILVGTVVEFRRVTKKHEGDGYYIVNTLEKEREENELNAATGNIVSDTPYLNVNDLIITSGNDLYDGKLID